MYRLASEVVLQGSAEGVFLIGKKPLRAVRLNGPMGDLAERCRRNAVAPKNAQEAEALEALARRGFLERERGGPLAEERLPSVSVVIPVKDRADELARCLESLQRLRYPKDKLEVIVVDDGSRDRSPAIAEGLGAVVVASGGCGRGPASARNRGSQVARGDLLAFIDSDCTAAPGWLQELVEAFEDPDVGAVGGRVEGMHVATALDRYEAAMSSLSLGKRERAGQGGDDTFYLPSCNLLVRRRAFLLAGGFREGMHVGEDVDLTWRLRDRGWKIRYVPRGWVWHEHRNRLGAFLRRRFDYGTSEALLQSKHPKRRKKMALPPTLTLALILVAVALLGPSWPFAVASVGVFAADVLWTRARLVRKGLRFSYRQIMLARARAFGSLVYYLGGHGLRYYGVPALLAAMLWPAFGLVLLATLAWVASVEHHVRKPGLPLVVFVVFYVAEHFAYGAGVFRGCVQHRSFSSYRPMIYRRMEMTFG